MNYICAILECSSIAVIAAGLEKERNKTKIWKLLVYLVVYIILFVLSEDIQTVMEISMISYILLFLYIKWAYKEDFIHTMLVGVMSAIITTILEFALMCLVPLFLDVMREIVVTSITMILALFVSRNYLGKFLDILEKWDFMYAVVCLLSLMMFTPALAIKIARKMDVTDYIYVAVCIVVMWMLVVRVQRFKLEDIIRKQYLEAYKEVLLQIRRRQHKIKNQINAAYSMFLIYDTYDELVEKQKEYLSKISDYELPNDAIILEEPSIISIIYEKINEAVERGIYMETSFSCSMVGSRISDVIWVELIGTLFDNAIEALDYFDGERKIWLEIGRGEKNKIILNIMNTFNKVSFSEISQFFKMGYSTKGEERGIGLYNVKQIVHKYRGCVNAMSKEHEGLRVIKIEIII